MWSISAGTRTRFNHRFFLNIAIVILVSCLVSGHADARRRTKMPDTPQTSKPEWGANWCAPTAVGNSFQWLAQEYPSLAGLVTNQSTGQPMSGVDLIDQLGKNHMNTSATDGTTAENVDKGKKSFIQQQGLTGQISVEMKAKPDKAWLLDQYKKGQDVEMGLAYYAKDENGKWVATGRHTQTFGDAPGYDVGGHTIAMADIEEVDPLSEDFILTFTDPARDDLTGEYGAIADDQYWLNDPAGNPIWNTASTYNVYYGADLFGDGSASGYTLDGYQGTGDKKTDGADRNKMTVVEWGWAESPVVPEPGSLLAMGSGLLIIAGVARRRSKS